MSWVAVLHRRWLITTGHIRLRIILARFEQLCLLLAQRRLFTRMVLLHFGLYVHQKLGGNPFFICPSPKLFVC